MVKRASRSSKRKAAAVAEEVEEAQEGMEVEEEQAAKEVEQEPAKEGEEEEAPMEKEEEAAEEENMQIAEVTTATVEVTIEKAVSIAGSDDADVQGEHVGEEPPVKKPMLVFIVHLPTSLANSNVSRIQG